MAAALLRRGRPGARAGAPDPRRPADRGLGRACAGQQIRLASAALPASPDPVGARDRDRPLGAGVLGRLCRGRADAAVAAHARDPARLAPAVCRRNPRPGARSRSRADQDRLLLVDRPRRQRLARRYRPAGGCLHLRAGTRRRACDGAACRLSRHRAVRRLCRLQAGRPSRSCRQRRDPGLLLEPLATAVLRDCQGRVGTDR